MFWRHKTKKSEQKNSEEVLSAERRRIAWFKIAKFFLAAFWLYAKKEFGWRFWGRCLIVVLLFAALAVFLLHSATAMNQDLGRHLKAGQIIWETKHVPAVNLFSYAEPDHSFINHHWLSEVVYYLLYLKIGVAGLIVFNAVVYLSAFVLIFYLAYRRRYFIFSLLTAMFSIGLLIERVDVRPEVFGFLFFALFLFILDKNKEKIGWTFWSLPFLQILWVNLHISFCFGWILMLIFFLDRLWARRKIVYSLAQNKKIDFYLARVVVGGILLGLAAFLNPNGWRGAVYPLLIFGNYGYSIAENQSPFFLEKFAYNPSIVFFKAAIAATVVSFLMNWRRIKVFYFLGSVVFFCFAWLAIRNFPILGLFLPLVLMDNFVSFRGKFSRFFVRWEDCGIRRWLRVLTVAAIFVILTGSIYAVAANHYYLTLSKSERFGLAESSGAAAAAVDFLQKHKISGWMFNNFDIGGYLIWRLFPDQSVFVDGRPEAYSEDFWQTVYIPMQSDAAAWRRYAEMYGFDYVFFAHTDATPWGAEFVRHLSRDSEWAMVYLNSSVAIWLKNSEKNVSLIQRLKASEGAWPLDIERSLREGNYNELLNLALFFQRVEANEAAVRFFDQALARYGKDEEIWLAAAAARLAAGDITGAKSNLRQALELEPECVGAHLELGRVYYQEGDFSSARRAWQKILEIEPDNKMAKLYLDNMGLIPFKK